MNLHTLPRVVGKRSKRLGRGIGSGKGGHTVGRGQKGQKSRRKISVSFFGTKMKKSLLKRIPMQRGKMKLKPNAKSVVVSSDKLLSFAQNAIVDVEALVKAGIVQQKETRQGVKIVKGKNTIDKPLELRVPAASSVIELIEKAGGNTPSNANA